MARSKVREVSAPSAIQGVAAPVSSYVRPAEPAKSSLSDLAQGLAALDSGMAGFLDKRKKEQSEADKARAVVDFNRNNQVGWAEAVRQGKVPPSASPIYMEWYKKTQGNLAGLRLRDKFRLDYQRWEGRGSADSDAFSAFASEWLSQNVGDEQDPHILAGLAPHLDQLTMGGLDTFMQERDQRIREGARATSGALITDTLVDTIDDGNASGTTDYDAFWQQTMELREEAIGRGELPADYDSLIVDSVLLQAERSSDMEILKLLDRTLPDQGHPMSYDPKVREAITKTQDRIVSAQGALSSNVARERERLEKQRQEDTWAGVLDLIHRGEPVPEEAIVQLSRRDGEARAKVARYQKEATELGIQESPEALLDLYTQIDGGAGVDYVLKMREQGVIRDPATLTKAIDRVKAVKAASSDGGIFVSPAYKDTVKFITSETADSQLSEAALMGGGTPPISSEGMEALFDYRQMLLDWETRNPDASLIEKEKAARDAGDAIRKRIVRPEGGSEKIYVSEADKAELERRATEEASKPHPAEEPETSEDDGDLWSGWANYLFGDGEDDAEATATPSSEPKADTQHVAPPPALETLSDARRSAVESLAQRRGIPMEEANRLLHDELEELMGEQRIDPTTTNSISEQSREELSSLLENPPTATASVSEGNMEPLRNLIAAAEGTDGEEGRRGYNETLGYGLLTGGTIDLVSMTLDEVDALQGQMLRHPDNKWNSSAVGRYQTTQRTLRDAREALGLNGSEKYTAEIQDRVADWLLQRRGVDEVLSGEMDLSTFLSNMGQEWQAFSSEMSGGSRAQSALKRLIQPTDLPRQGTGLAALVPNGLVASNKRGRKPDLDNLRPEVRDGMSRLQQKWGREIPIVSGYRSPSRNAKARGARHSQHMNGNAVDLDVSNLSRGERIELIRLASQQGFTGIGVYANSLHLDYGKRRYWGPSHRSASLPAWAKEAIREHMGREA